MTFETKADFESALARLRRRDPALMAAFILSLAQDWGPVGEQVRTFILGDDVAETAESLRQRLRSLESPSDYVHRHTLGKAVGQRLGFILDGIETLVLPTEPRRAFALPVEFFEADARAMEECGEHHWTVECAFERAAGIMGEAAKAMAVTEAAAEVSRLMAVDSYGLRRVLGVVVPKGGER
jgi:hypothetical protein